MTTRRQFLALLAGGALGLASCAGGAPTVSLMAAGSLSNAFENGLRRKGAPAVDLQIEARGSAAVARMVAEGQRDPHIVALADTVLFDAPLRPDWYATFATNALVVAYNADTAGGQRVAQARRWYEPIQRGAARLGRTDPNADPLGYRALLMLELAARYYDGAGDLRKTIPQQEQVFPETGLVSQFESGAIDAAIAYRSMAVERGYDYLDLPAQIDLSAPRFADDWYRTVSYTLPSGKRLRGGVIRYGATVRRMTDAAARVFEPLVAGGYLDDFGFRIPDDYPQFHGSSPRRLQR